MAPTAARGPTRKTRHVRFPAGYGVDRPFVRQARVDVVGPERRYRLVAWTSGVVAILGDAFRERELSFHDLFEVL